MEFHSLARWSVPVSLKILTGNPFTMENQRKIPKRIFSLFLAILCIFGILFVSYIDSFAESVSINFYNDSNYDGILYIRNNATNAVFIEQTINKHTFYTYTFTDFSIVYRVELWVYDNRNYYWEVTSPSNLSRDASNPTVLDSNIDIHFTSRSIGIFKYYLSFVAPTPTPSPAPTPTPAPATPTPDPYGPGPVPTIPPGEANYTSFFNRLASDAQNAFNAIFLSWQNANNKFYSGLFFIGFPVLLGIIGLVASIFFGDDD